MLGRKVLGLLSVVLFALCFVVPVTAQMIPPSEGDTGLGGANTITGMVLVPSGQRLERRITIRLQTMTRGDRVTMTDDYGKFAFQGLVSGDYTVVIDKEKEYEPYSQQVQVRQFRGFPPQLYNLNIRLEFKGRVEAKPGVLSADLANVPRRALEFYNKALEQSQAGKNKDAIEQLKQAISEYPSFMLAFNELGVQYLRLGELEKAEQSLRSALKLKPDGFEPLMNHGIALVRLNRFDEAEPELRAALKQKDQSAVGHFYLGRALAYLQRYDEAEKELNTAIQLGGDEMKEAHRYLAGIYNARGDKKRAISELETYLKLAPNSKDADHLRQLIRDLRSSK